MPSKKSRDLYKYYLQMCDGQKVSRKTKKSILGKRMNKSKLRKRIGKVRVAEERYDGGSMLSDYFCPKCGCSATTNYGNAVSPPEVYQKEYCLRCGFLVVIADNSPSVHCLEFPEFNYTIDGVIP